jgi:hypothetical protein
VRHQAYETPFSKCKLAGSWRAGAPGPPAPTAAELKKKFALLAQGTEGEGAAFSNLMHTTPRRLVAYLKTHEVSAAEAKKLNLDLSAAYKDAAHLKVFTYRYSSGGTRGTVHRPVLQWQNAAGQRFAYAVPEEREFTEIHKLAGPGHAQYLLLGEDRGSGKCYLSVAYVIELQGNYLLINSAAFSKNIRLGSAAPSEAALILCNVLMEFETHQQVLRVVDTESESDNKPATKDYMVLKWTNTRFAEVQ